MTRFLARTLVVGSLAALAALASCQSRGPKTTEALRRDGDRAYLAGDYQAAEDAWREVVTRSPGEKEYRKAYGLALLANGKPGLAREHLEIAYTFRPRDPETIEALATAMMKSGDVEGMTRFLKGLAQERASTEDWMRLGRLMNAAGDRDEARRAYLIAARVDGGRSLEPQMALAELYASIGDEPNAVDRLRMAYYLKPKSERVLDLARQLDQIIGPTFGKRPLEQLPIGAESAQADQPMN